MEANRRFSGYDIEKLDTRASPSGRTGRNALHPVQEILEGRATRRAPNPSVLSRTFSKRSQPTAGLSSHPSSGAKSWTVLTLYRIITVFLTLFFRGSCNSSPLSGSPCVGSGTHPPHGFEANFVIIANLFPHNRLGASLRLESASYTVRASVRGRPRNRPAGSHCRDKSPWQPPNPG
jgi:hypothetical protein